MLMRPFVAGVGAILTLHHVRPHRPGRFQPNRLLEVTPHFLEGVVRYLRAWQIDIVNLDERHRRLTEGDFARRFVCITIDDGYRDTLQWAYPILKRHEVPFALYIPTSFPDRIGELWWLALEAVVAHNEHIRLLVGGREQGFDCATLADKRHMYGQLYSWVRNLPTEDDLRKAVRDPLPGRHGRVLPGLVHGLGRTRPARGRSARDHRCPHGQSRKACESVRARGSLRNGHEPRRDRSLARR